MTVMGDWIGKALATPSGPVPPPEIATDFRIPNTPRNSTQTKFTRSQSVPPTIVLDRNHMHDHLPVTQPTTIDHDHDSDNENSLANISLWDDSVHNYCESDSAESDNTLLPRRKNVHRITPPRDNIVHKRLLTEDSEKMLKMIESLTKLVQQQSEQIMAQQLMITKLQESVGTLQHYIQETATPKQRSTTTPTPTPTPTPPQPPTNPQPRPSLSFADVARRAITPEQRTNLKSIAKPRTFASTTDYELVYITGFEYMPISQLKLVLRDFLDMKMIPSLTFVGKETIEFLSKKEYAQTLRDTLKDEFFIKLNYNPAKPADPNASPILKHKFYNTCLNRFKRISNTTNLSIVKEFYNERIAELEREPVAPPSDPLPQTNNDPTTSEQLPMIDAIVPPAEPNTTPQTAEAVEWYIAHSAETLTMELETMAEPQPAIVSATEPLNNQQQ